MKTAAIYCRVSTDSQEREGTSLQTQLEACLKYCHDKGYEVAYRFSEAYSGLSLERPELDKLRELVRTEAIDVIVCYCLDRLSRDPGHGVIITQELERYGVKLETVTEDVDNSELGKLISYIRGYASKVEVEKIRERTMRGKRARATAGRLPSGTGHKLYGYTYVPGKQVGEGIRYVNEAEAPVVRNMFTWLVSDGMTVNGITHRLRGLNIPTPAGSAFWIRQTVYRMLTNPAYIGKSYAFTKQYVEPKTRRGPNTKRKKTGVIARPRDQWIEIHNATPAIVDAGLFEAAQAILKRNKELARRHSKREYLLSGYVFCARCGYRYQGYVKKWAKPKPSEMRYYRCGKSQGIVAPERCRNKQLPANRLEAAVWQEVEQVLSKPEIMLAELQRMGQEARAAADLVNSWTSELAMTETKLRNLEKQKDRIYYAFKIVGDEVKFRADVAAYQADKQALEKQSTDLTEKLQAYNKAQVDVEGIKMACELVKKNLKTLTFVDKRLALEALNIRVKVDGENIIIQGSIPVLNSSIENPSTK